MRVKTIELLNHPVLGSLRYSDFDTETKEKDIATFFVGANGSGKSFFLEAIVEIFQTLFENQKAPFSFVVEIINRSDVLKVSAKMGQKPILEIPNGRKLSDFIPANLLFYYSGETKRSLSYFERYYKKHKTEIINGGRVKLPSFFYIDPALTDLILLTLLIYKPKFENSHVWKHTKIIGIDKVVIKIKPQKWYEAHYKSDEEFNIYFWGALGELSNFCDDLNDSSKSRKTQKVVLKTDEEDEEFNFITELTIEAADFSILRERISSPKRFFELIINLHASELMDDLSISIFKVGSEKTFSSKYLSEGEKQLLLVLGFVELAQNEKTIFLLDEPDTHLNPLWKYFYMKNLQDVVNTDPENLQFFICSHDPLLISGLEAEQIVFIERDGDKVKLKQAEEDMMAKGVEAILTSSLFGLATTLDYATYEKITERRLLIAKGISKKLTKEETTRLEELTNDLRGIDFTIPYNDPAFVDYLSQIDESQLTGYAQPFNRATHYDVRQKAKKLFQNRKNDSN